MFKFNCQNIKLLLNEKTFILSRFFGIITLSVLSSCRTEDGAMTQKQVEDKRFAVFVPQPGKTVNYANGFAYLMQRYDNLHRTNLSGFNNNIPTIGNLTASVNKNASVSQTSVPYIEFAIHSQTVTEENGDKWVVFPKVEGEKVTGLILAILSNKETNVSYKTIDSQTEWYAFNISKFQYAFSNYLKRNKFQNLSASIKPMANGDCGDDVQRCGEIPEVVITVPKDPGTPKAPVTIITPIIDTGTCTDFQSCAPGGGGGGGGGDIPSLPDIIEFIKPKYYIKDLKKYLSCLNQKLPANLTVYAEKMGDGNGVGHAFISISQGDNRMTFGFYPNNPDSWVQKSLHYDGIMGDNSDSHYTHSKDYGQISPNQLKNIIDLALEFDKTTYNISASNCSTFASNVMTIAGETNIAYIPATPNTIISRFGKEASSQTGKGPSTQSTCNQ